MMHTDKGECGDVMPRALAVAVLNSAVQDYCGRGRAREGKHAAHLAVDAGQFLFAWDDVGTRRWFELAGVEMDEFRVRWTSEVAIKDRMLEAWDAELEARKTERKRMALVAVEEAL